MANILELQEQRQLLKDKLSEIVSNGEAEKRELNDTETNEIAQIKTQIAELDEQVRAIEKENEKLSQMEVRKNIIENKENRTSNNMKLINLINDVVNSRSFSEEAQAHIDAAKGEGLRGLRIPLSFCKNGGKNGI